MTKDKTESYQRQLLHTLVNDGWSLKCIEPELLWLAVEHWTMASQRRAYGTEVILSFMTNPEGIGERDIWEIQASTKTPENSMDAVHKFAGMMITKGHFMERLKVFVTELNEHRDHVQTVKNKHTPLSSPI